ncbi:MAG: hypothetical protein U5L09_18440 [Bacteroidales bacterium]|nr:hypothetical protein [Bacteroidales bacterium]
MNQNGMRDPHIKIFNFKLTPYIGVGKSLFLWFLLISVLPLAIVSYINYLNAFEGLTIVAEKTLVNSSKLREDNLNAYFGEIEQDLKYYSALEENREFLNKLREAYLQADIPLEDFVQSSAYEKLTKQQHKAFNNYRAIHEYYDVYLIDLAGNVLFSVKRDGIFGTNVYDGEYSGTRIGKTVQRILETGNTLFSDFERTSTFESKNTGILGKLVYNEAKQIKGVLAFGILAEDINEIVSSKNRVRGVAHHLHHREGFKDSRCLRQYQRYRNKK